MLPSASLPRTGWMMALLLVLPWPWVASACSCVSPVVGLCGQVKSAATAFRGVVLTANRGADSTVYTFSVGEAWRGGPRQGMLVEVEALNDGAACGITFEPGVEYLVFPTLREGRYRTWLCDGNLRWQEAVEQLPLLRAAGREAVVWGFLSQRPGDGASGQATWPTPDVEVHAIREGSMAPTATARTDSRGRYLLAGLPAGRYRLETPAGFAAVDGSANVEISDAACIWKPFTQARLARLEGFLADADGEPDDSSDLYLQPRGAAPAEAGELRASAEEGKFRFEVPPGRYHLEVRELGYLDRIAIGGPLELREGANPPLRLRLAQRASRDVEGLVVDDGGRPVEGATVWISGRMPDGAQLSGSVRSPANGRFRFTGLAVVEIQLKAVWMGCEAASVVPVTRLEPVQLTLGKCR